MGTKIVDSARGPSPLGMTTGFFTAMDRALPTWEPVPLFQLDGGAAGPVAEDYCQEVVADAEAQLRAAGPLDAVFCPMHGGTVRRACVLAGRIAADAAAAGRGRRGVVVAGRAGARARVLQLRRPSSRRRRRRYS